MATKKMTISEMFAQIIAKAEKGEPLSADEVKFLKERKDGVDKKNATRTMTATQKENETIKAEILDYMEDGKAYTIGDIMKLVPKCADLTNQRVSAIVRQLKDALLVSRSEVKGRAYFTKA